MESSGAARRAGAFEPGADYARAFERCIEAGGIALFPTDTVYGLAVDPRSPAAVERLYRLKGRPPARPAAVMFFSLEALFDTLADLPPRTHAALERLLPGPLTLVLANHAHRFPLACGPVPDRLGVRVPRIDGPLAMARATVLQSSANRSGEPDPRSLDEVDAHIRRGVDLALDGGELPGTPSTVVDLSDYEGSSAVEILREGAIAAAAVHAALR